MNEIHFNNPDMPVFAWPEGKLNLHQMLKELPFWLLHPGQQMHIPYNDEMFRIIDRWTRSMLKRKSHNKHERYHSLDKAEFWLPSIQGNEIVIALHKDMFFNTPKSNPTKRQIKLAEINRMRVGQHIAHTNGSGVVTFVKDIHKIEVLTGKVFDFAYFGAERDTTVRITRVL